MVSRTRHGFLGAGQLRAPGLETDAYSNDEVSAPLNQPPDAKFMRAVWAVPPHFLSPCISFLVPSFALLGMVGRGEARASETQNSCSPSSCTFSINHCHYVSTHRFKMRMTSWEVLETDIPGKVGPGHWCRRSAHVPVREPEK